jgi:phenylpropionate dioxygenase-like ring-hydroxylating dioxygenase large terminal subunit
MKRFHVNEDIQRAFTLDSEFYISEEAYEEAKEKIFTRTWQILGNSDEFHFNE